MSKSAQWIISEAGFASLNAAGITTGWLKAWLLSAGASSVSIHLLESGHWQHESAVWRLFLAEELEIVEAARSLGLQVEGQKHGEIDLLDTRHLLLENPRRICWLYQTGHHSILFLSPGDIIWQRETYLSPLNHGEFIPLHIYAGEKKGVIKLETGMSATLGSQNDQPLEASLNSSGLLIEEQLISLLRERGLGIRTVESCTAGGIAARLCRVPGASDVVDRSWVTYSNAAKVEEVGVSPLLITDFGAVSREVAAAMAEGGGDDKHVCIAVTGIAGPGGGTVEKPVGTVWVGLSLPGIETITTCLHLTGARHDIQAQTVIEALHLLLIEVERSHPEV